MKISYSVEFDQSEIYTLRGALVPWRIAFPEVTSEASYPELFPRVINALPSTHTLPMATRLVAALRTLLKACREQSSRAYWTEKAVREGGGISKAHENLIDVLTTARLQMAANCGDALRIADYAVDALSRDVS